MRTLGDLVATSIRQECSAKKLGNVHPQASFSNMSYATFLEAAQAIGKCVDQHFHGIISHRTSPAESTESLKFVCTSQDVRLLRSSVQIGEMVLGCVLAMQDAVAVNTSLGTILLFAPILCSLNTPIPITAVSESLPEFTQGGRNSQRTEQRINQTLSRMTPADSQMVYQAIALCSPGGLGESPEMSVHQAAPVNLLDAMRYAADIDDVALQFVTRFELVRSIADRIEEMEGRLRSFGSNSCAPELTAGQPTPRCILEEAVTLVQLELLADRPDSLIARKGGRSLAEAVQSRAIQLYVQLPAESPEYAWLFARTGDAKSPPDSGNLSDQGENWSPVADNPHWLELDRWMRKQMGAGGKQLANPGTHADLIAAALLVMNLRNHAFL